MTIPTLKVLASLLQLHGPGTAVQSDNQGINALLNKSPDPIKEENTGVYIAESDSVDVPSVIPVWFRRGFVGPYGGFRRGYIGPYGGFRRGYVGPYGGFRRGFGRGW
jgi:hypothetical protein